MSVSTCLRQQIQLPRKLVMHEQPSFTSERMTIHARDRNAGCSADVSEEQVRLQMTAQVAEIFADENR